MPSLKGKWLDCMIKLIATDMDGTFLDANGSYDRERFGQVLKGLKAKGIRFAVASGRSYLGVEKLFEEFRDDLIFIAENGSLVMEKGQIHFEALMDKETYTQLVDLLENGPFELHGEFLLSGRRAGYVLPAAADSYAQAMKEYYGQVERLTDLEDLDDEIFKLTADIGEDTVFAAAEWLSHEVSGVTAMVTGFRAIDIIRDDVDKRTGLEQLCQDLGLTADQVIAFGDNLNDYQMMEFAGVAVAPENARPEIKALADEIIADHRTGSVMDYLERIAYGD